MAKSSVAILAMLVCLVTAGVYNVLETKAIVKKYEPLYLTATVSPRTGLLTIGWGHTGPDVFVGMTITQLVADSYLTSDLQMVSNLVSGRLLVNLNMNQLGAYASFAFSLSSTG